MQETHELHVTEEDVEQFSELSGDCNPLHLSETYASETMFGERIAHGMLVASAISAAIAKLDGTIIYLSQDIDFEAPVPLDTTIKAKVELSDRDGDKLTLETTVVDGSQTVVSGEAEVMQR